MMGRGGGGYKSKTRLGKQDENYKTPPRVDTCQQQTKPSPPGGKQSSNRLLGELRPRRAARPINALLGWVGGTLGGVKHRVLAYAELPFLKLQGLVHPKRERGELFVG